jgi:hypothetical protein
VASPLPGSPNTDIVSEASDENIRYAASVLSNDTYKEIVVMIYASNLTKFSSINHANIKSAVEKMRIVKNKLITAGADPENISLGFCNKRSEFVKKHPHVKPAGVYLWIKKQ